MTYWHLQMNQPEGRGGSIFVDSKEMLAGEQPIIGCNIWESTQSENFQGNIKNSLTIGDIVLVHEGQKSIALCRVTGPCESNENLQKQFHQQVFRQVEVIGWINSDKPFPQPQGTLQRLIDPNTESWKYVDHFIKIFSQNMHLENAIKLLKYKSQIILQGPPGTGKTRLAKHIAEEMTKTKNLGSPIKQIELFFSSYDPGQLEISKHRKTVSDLIQEFYQYFPKEKLIELSLSNYPLGTDDERSFCWWLEYGLWELGGYSGVATKFKIFWRRDTGELNKSGFVKSIEDDTVAMRMLAEQISNVANEQNLNDALDKLSKGLVLKILHSYHPDVYFPINNEICIDNALKLFGLDGAGLNVIQKNKKLQEQFLSLKSKFKADVTNVEFMRFLFGKFDLKGNVSFESNEVISSGAYKVIQFHPAYSYEDFVRGISAKSNEKGQVEYSVENRVFADLAAKALDNPSANFVLVIDEINRANLPAVLGELIYALEYRYDFIKPDENTVESMYALKRDAVDLEGDKSLKLPKNLFVIGTMNTADRSVGHIDYAIRRRFAFVDIPPSIEVIEQVVKDYALKTKAKALFEAVGNLFKDGNLASDFEANDVQLGHSYFLAETEEMLQLKLKYEIKPLLREYLKDGILQGDDVKKKIELLHV